MTPASKSNDGPATSRPRPAASSKPQRKSVPDEVDDDPWNAGSSYTEPTYDDYGNYGQKPAAKPRAVAGGKKNNGLMVGLLAGGGLALIGVIIFAISAFIGKSGPSDSSDSSQDLASDGGAVAVDPNANVGGQGNAANNVPPIASGMPTMPDVAGTGSTPPGGRASAGGETGEGVDMKIFLPARRRRWPGSCFIAC